MSLPWEEPVPELLTVRAAVNMSGLALGEEADVDPRDPFIATLIASQILVPVAPE